MGLLIQPNKGNLTLIIRFLTMRRWDCRHQPISAYIPFIQFQEMFLWQHTSLSNKTWTNR